METFNFKSHGNGEKTSKLDDREVRFEGGNIQIGRLQVNPEIIWLRNFSGLKEEADELEAFFNRHGRVYKFYWQDDDGVTHIVRFWQKEIKFTEKRGIKEDGTYGIIAYETQILFRKEYE